MAMLGFLKSNSAPVAIDFGYSAVKVLQVQPGESMELIGAAMLEIPESIRSNTVERSLFLQESLPKLLPDGGFKGKTASCSIPAWQTFVQHLQIEKTDSVQIREQVGTQLQMTIGCDPSCAVIRHVEVGEVFREGRVMQEVIAFAVSREVVMGQVELLKKCKLEVAGLHAEPIAILHAYRHLYRRAGDENTTTLYVDIGYHGTKAMIAHGTELKFAKSIPVGGRHFDEEIARALHCEQEAAHAHRMQEICSANQTGGSYSAMNTGSHAMQSGGQSARKGAMISLADEAGRGASEKPPMQTTITADGYERRTGSIPREFQKLDDGNDLNDEGSGNMKEESLVRRSMADAVLQQIDELRLCVRYHRAMYPNRPLDRMIMNGGESRDRELCRRIAAILGVTSYVGDPLKRVVAKDSAKQLTGIDHLYEQPGWAVPMGLCIAPVDG